MKMWPKLIVLLLPCLASCNFHRYLYRGKFYGATDAFAAQRQAAANDLARITPHSEPLHGHLVVVLPPDDALKREIVPAVEGLQVADVLRETYTALLRADLDTQIAVIEKRRLFARISILRNDSELPADRDWTLTFALVKGHARWQLAASGWQSAWPVTSDGTRGYAEEISSWLTSVEGLVTAAVPPPNWPSVGSAEIPDAAAGESATDSPSYFQSSLSLAVFMEGGGAFGPAARAEDAELLRHFDAAGNGQGLSTRAGVFGYGLAVEWAPWSIASSLRLGVRGQFSSGTITKTLDVNWDNNLRESHSAELMHDQAWLAGPMLLIGSDLWGLSWGVPLYVMAGPLRGGRLRSYPILRYYDAEVLAGETAFFGWRFDSGAGLRIAVLGVFTGFDLGYSLSTLTQAERLYPSEKRRSALQGARFAALIGIRL